jgi:hypothetical protein
VDLQRAVERAPQPGYPTEFVGDEAAHALVRAAPAALYHNRERVSRLISTRVRGCANV